MRNRLDRESSLYLRQHAGDPVHWQPWDEDALRTAREGDRPILLSIGYSACHWCHVMAHECFADPATAERMNRDFVCIKVDREERPDLDRIYQLAHQALTRRGGGWPLTLFLDPRSLLPFFAGTYFPPTPRHGLPAFAEVLDGVHRWWDGQREQVLKQNEALQGFLDDYATGEGSTPMPDDQSLRLARQRILERFDPEQGGQRGAPKFPPSGELALLLAFARDGDAAAEQAATTTLVAMARRGLYDHLAGGFFRYCVDAEWSIPHFEKMLYDNAQLLPLYAEAAGRWCDPALAAVADGTLAWLDAEMATPGGAYGAALDADSEGEEGRYYLWTREQFAEVLAPAPRALALLHFGLDGPANFESRAWHLHATRTAAELAGLRGQDAETIAAELRQARQDLLAVRQRRVRPTRDDKPLTAWNALLADGLARAGLALGREDWLDRAESILALVAAEMDDRGRLPAVLGGAGPGFLDDHAFALRAAMRLLPARWSSKPLQLATQLAETLLSDFQDDAAGGFFFTAHDHETLPQRPKPWLDEATPSGNGMAAGALLELGHLLAEPRYLDAAEACLRAGWHAVAEQPQAAASMLMAWSEWRRPTPTLVLRGDPRALLRWRQALAEPSLPPLRLYAIANPGDDLPEALAGKPVAAAGMATLCRGLHCLASTRRPEDIVELLREG